MCIAEHIPSLLSPALHLPVVFNASLNLHHKVIATIHSTNSDTVGVVNDSTLDEHNNDLRQWKNNNYLVT